MRLGVPFVLGVFLLMPLAHYPVYRVTAHDPSWSAFWAHLRALPFWPSGPLWFLWQLLAFNIAAAALYRFVPGTGDFLGRLSMTARELPSRYFTLLLAISCLAYLPLAWKFKPWEWIQFGPFSLQPGRLLHYLVYFLAGASAGMHGLERGLLSSDGMLAKQWGRWVSGGLAAFLLWIIATALTMQGENAIVPHLGIVADLAFVLSSASVCFGFAAIFLRLAAKPWPAFETISENSYGIYLVHYVFVVWLQYLLLGLTLIAVAEGAIVFTGALMLSWAIAATISRVPIGNRLLGAKR
jgi:hypothetical protein